ncbi:MAG: aldehyde dehydrogenase family protein, partial [Bacteroidia bacterium]|nr:aldehyde dehydrogenase family protein [Bacteroidia bacterium]
SEAIRFSGEMVPLDYGAGEGKTAFTKRYPVGIITCITPFNFPLNLVLHKVAPALACGCAVIVKPAPQSPLCTLALAGLMELAGYPAGVFNAMVCDIPVAEKLVRDDRIEMLSFTGSDKVGWYLKSICGKKKIALELGGNASVIVDSTANIDEAAKKVAVGAYIYAGQVCISTQRIFVEDKVYDQFTEKLITAIDDLGIGDPNDKNVLVGPIIDSSHLERVGAWVNEAKDGGATVLIGGEVSDKEHNVYKPTLLTGANDLMKVSCAEVFGPVAVIEKVRSFEEGVKRSNDSNYGLQTGIYTNRFDRVKYAHEELEVGGVMVNNIPGFRIDSMPYGGIKDSGFGREGIKYAMEEMTEGRLIVY